jgi:hypothetical protein
MSQTSDDRPLLDRLRDLHERLEHDAELEEAYLKDQDAFHRDHGFDPKEVEAALAELGRQRIAGYKGVLEAHGKKLG